MLEFVLDMLADMIEVLITSEKTPHWLRRTLLGAVGIFMACLAVFLGLVAARFGSVGMRVLSGMGALVLLLVCVMGVYCLAARRKVRQ